MISTLPRYTGYFAIDAKEREPASVEYSNMKRAGLKVSRLALGTVALQLLHGSPCPVLCVPAQAAAAEASHERAPLASESDVLSGVA